MSVCWQKQMENISARLKYPTQSLMTIQRHLVIGTSMKSHFATMKPVRCWKTSTKLTSTVRNTMIDLKRNVLQMYRWDVFVIFLFFFFNVLLVFSRLPSPVKPNAPCCLTVSHNSSHHHFAWKSTYERYNESTALPENLIYQLRLYKPGDEQVVRLGLPWTGF